MQDQSFPRGATATPAPRTRRPLTVFMAAIVAVLLFALSAIPAWAADSLTLTFVRHGESEGNASGFIDTKVPGPPLTALGQTQADAVAAVLAARNAQNPYDGIYASDMIRTQQTAAPTAAALDKTVVVLPGLHEINAGIFEGQSQDSGLGRIGYVLSPLAWALGARFVPLLGSTDADGNVFEGRVDGAVQTIYDNGDRNALVFSHGATIMFWTMMNVDNPDLSLILSHPLGNTAIVVVTGNPEDGWTLQNWDGVAVSADPNLITKLFVDVRTAATAPQEALYNVNQALATGDIVKIVNAVRDGVVNVTAATANLPFAVTRDVIDAVVKAIPGAGTPVVTPNLATAKAVADTTEDKTETKVDATQTTKVTADLKDTSTAEPAKTAKAKPRALAKVAGDSVSDSNKSAAPAKKHASARSAAKAAA
jgi:broad specificity phosphatase PhoE